MINEAGEGGAARALRRASVWLPGKPPRMGPSDETVPSGGTLWFDIDRLTASPDSIMDVYGPRCHGLTREMVKDLLAPDRYPEGRHYPNEQVRLVSTFSVRALPAAQREEGEPPSERFESPGDLLMQPVELIAGPGWLLSCWHMRRRYRGINPVATVNPEDADDLVDEVGKCWTAKNGKSSGDLGVLVMHELALTYAPVHRKLYDWLEEWELNLYVVAGAEREPLGQIWGSMSLLRRWIGPLNPPGVRSDVQKSWLPGATNRDEIVALDDRIDKALSSLRELGKAIRTAFGQMHAQLEEEGRERRERSTRSVEILAALFLVPTLVVGFFGANTWLPGDAGQSPGTTRAFTVMLIALGVLTASALAAVLFWQRTQRRRDSEAKVQRQRLQESMLEVPERDLPALAPESMPAEEG
jgi:hypothetical protein